MVEKTGHKTIIRNERLKWIEEGRPKSKVDDDDVFGEQLTSGPTQPNRIAPIFEKAGQGRGTTPANDDLFGDEDIYNATPRARQGAPKPTDDVPDDDDLAALMAEQDGPSTAAPSFGGLFGGGPVKKAAQASREPDEDEMDALMAEAEGSTQPSKPTQPVRNSIFGDGGSKGKATPVENDEDEDDLDALMAEAEIQTQPTAKIPAKTPAPAVNKAAPSNVEEDGDDLDALMAEAEAEALVSAPKEAQKEHQPSAEDEEAMAEMDGLW